MGSESNKFIHSYMSKKKASISGLASMSIRDIRRSKRAHPPSALSVRSFVRLIIAFCTSMADSVATYEWTNTLLFLVLFISVAIIKMMIH